MTGTVNSIFAAKQKRYTRKHNIMMWSIHNPQFLFNLIISNELKLYLCTPYRTAYPIHLCNKTQHTSIISFISQCVCLCTFPFLFVLASCIAKGNWFSFGLLYQTKNIRRCENCEAEQQQQQQNWEEKKWKEWENKGKIVRFKWNTTTYQLLWLSFAKYLMSKRIWKATNEPKRTRERKKKAKRLSRPSSSCSSYSIFRRKEEKKTM